MTKQTLENSNCLECFPKHALGNSNYLESLGDKLFLPDLENATKNRNPTIKLVPRPRKQAFSAFIFK